MTTARTVNMKDPNRMKVWHALDRMTRRYHMAELVEGPHGAQGMIHANPTLMLLSYLLDLNHGIVGQPGWGKTTGAKVMLSMLTGRPYDLYDSLEIRGFPGQTQEGVVARLDFARLSQGQEVVIWRGTFGLPALMVDEVSRLPHELQAMLLQVIATGRANYLNSSVCEGKKPTFMTWNPPNGDDDSIQPLVAAFLDRIDIVTEEGYYTPFIVREMHGRTERVEQELWDPEYTTRALNALAGAAGARSEQRMNSEYEAFRAAIAQPSGKLVSQGRVWLSPTEKARINSEILEYLTEYPDPARNGFSNEALYFLMAVIAETNYSDQYGFKRSADPFGTENTHDAAYAVSRVRYGTSPRSVMAVEKYAAGLAWLLGDPQVDLAHVRYVLPYVLGHKLDFGTDYLDTVEQRRRRDWLPLAAARQLVEEIHVRYMGSVQHVINVVAKVQRLGEESAEITDKEREALHGSKVLLALAKSALNRGELTDEEKTLLRDTKEAEIDHPLYKEFLRIAHEWLTGAKAVYESSEEE